WHRVQVVKFLPALQIVATSPASSNRFRCFVTACRLMSRCSQSCPSVCPLSARNRSSNNRRPGSASALNTLSTSPYIPTIICNQTVACKALSRHTHPQGLLRVVFRGGTAPRLSESSHSVIPNGVCGVRISAPSHAFVRRISLSQVFAAPLVNVLCGGGHGFSRAEASRENVGF